MTNDNVIPLTKPVQIDPLQELLKDGARKMLWGVAIFAKDFSGHPARKNRQKCTRPLMPSAAPIRPASFVSTQQGVETLLRNDLTPFRKACIFTTLKLRENTCTTAIAD